MGDRAETLRPVCFFLPRGAYVSSGRSPWGARLYDRCVVRVRTACVCVITTQIVVFFYEPFLLFSLAKLGLSAPAVHPTLGAKRRKKFL